LLAHCLTTVHGKDSTFAKALGTDQKGKISVLLYALGIGLSFVHPIIGVSVYALVAALWFIPDQRFEKVKEPQ
jgi:uncharacterized membrane protein